jgi:diguanylate cyclase (GGDEF)-like protein/PAS domain S-box-containing protein
MQAMGLALEQQFHDHLFTLEEQVRQGQLLSMAALHICQSIKIDEILGTSATEVLHFLDADRVIIYRFDSSWNGAVVVEALMEGWSSMVGQTVHDPCFIQHWIKPYAEGRIQAVADIYASGLSQCHVDFLAQFQIRANLVVPILQGRDGAFETEHNAQSPQLWGLLVAQQCSAPRQWNVSEIDFLQKLAIYVELGIQKAELYAQAQAELDERQQAEIEVRRLNVELEQRISDRTIQLEMTNQKLQQEIIERKSIERTLFAEKELAQVTLQSIGDAVITTDAQGNIQYFNPIAEELTGWKLDEVKGIPLVDVFNIIHETTRRPVENPLHQVLRSGQIVGLANNSVLIARDGTEYPIEDSASPIRACNGEVIGVVLVFHDVTQSRYLTRQLAWQANHDEMTGLFNRRYFERLLNDAIISARSHHQHHVLCYLDLDQFKVVNDTCGHRAGDELLSQITTLLQGRVRVSDTLARLGGDEFGLLLNQCSPADAEKVADSLRSLVQDFRFVWQGKIFTIGVSIGLVAIDATSQSLSSVLSSADAACYAAKERGRNNIYVYHSNDQELERHRCKRQWISKIDQALLENRFCLYSQKIAPISHSKGIEHHEILLRMVDEAGKLIPPMMFIPTAERYHQIAAIDQWVIHSFFSSYRAYSEQAFANGTAKEHGLYTINLSGGSVSSDLFLSFLKEQFAEHRIPPQAICFEITETTAIENLDQASQLIHSLKDLGCRFALDDFGSGMSSLAYLKNLPVDYLKIDGGFIKDIDSDHMDYVMVECFNRLSHLMGIQTIAECVESEAVLIKLQTIGVDYAQGYCLDRPHPLSFTAA